MSDKQGSTHHLKEDVAEFLHTMQDTDHAFRMIVVKKTATPVLHGLEQFLTEEELLFYASERYSAKNAPNRPPFAFASGHPCRLTSGHLSRR